MPNFLCTTCGTQYPDSLIPPDACVICTEERQYVGWQGQRWTTLEELRIDHRNRFEPEGDGPGRHRHRARPSPSASARCTS